jgi:ribosomal protein S18 acetylase RimI-like enzyme
LTELIRLRFDLGPAIAAPRWPAGIAPIPFDERRAFEVHALLWEAHAGRPAGIAPFAAWWTALCDDAEYDPALVFLAADAGGGLAGVAQCWTSAFVKDLAVRADARRRGVGRALLLHAFAAFRARGAAHVDLKVDAGNATARQVYASLGMIDIGL